jgi:membrane peptidoglycan carboxypeptidase
MGKLTPGKFDIILGIGQYPITVKDHANGIATMAAGGLRAQAHFVASVADGDKVIYSDQLPKPGQQPIFAPQASNDLTHALSQVSSSKLNVGWDSAGKTGTWEYNNRTDQNAHAWMVGYTKKLAAAVWVGNQKNEQAIKDKSGATIWGSGIPTQIWKKFMGEATKALNEKQVNTKFNPPSGIGNENPDRSVPSPTPTEPPPPVEPTLPPTIGPSGQGGIFPTTRRPQ